MISAQLFLLHRSLFVYLLLTLHRVVAEYNTDKLELYDLDQVSILCKVR